MNNQNVISVPLCFRTDEATGVRQYDVETMVIDFTNKLKKHAQGVKWLEIVWDSCPNPQHKYLHYDIDEGLTFGFLNDDEVMDFLSDWNREMDEPYSSIEDFNKGEDYYEIVVNPFWMNE